MPRPIRKTVYERIEDKKNEILNAEEQLRTLKEELQVLHKEQDELEMSQMLQSIRDQGIDINKALELLNATNNVTTTQSKVPDKQKKQDVKVEPVEVQ